MANNNLPSTASNQTQGLVLSTKQTFLNDFSLIKVQQKCRRIENFPDILKSGMPSIATVKRKFGDDFIQAYIEGWVVNIREFINVGKKMTDEQTRETAILIVDEYYNMNLADINMIFKNAKLGKYGKYYDRLDGQIILSWFEQHFSERCRLAAEESIREAENYKDDPFQRTSTYVKMNEFIKKSTTREVYNDFNRQGK